jgi:hypothetical protein
VGFECHFGSRAPAVTPRWERFFDFLVAQGLCDPSAWEALRAWPGTSMFPAGPSDGDGPPGSCAIKGFNHVKVSYGDGFPLEAKLYFGALVKRASVAGPVVRQDHLARSWRRHLVVEELSAVPRPAAFAALPLLGASLDHLLRQWCNDFPHAVHVMTFPAVEGFRNESERQAGTVFPRALIADALSDANEMLRGLLDPVLAEEVAAAVASRRTGPGQGWAYFPGLSELPPDTDTLAQVLQLLVRNGAWHAIEEHARPHAEQAVHETSDVPGTVATWLLPAAGHTAAQERQREYVHRAWGDTLDTEVIANFLYALALLDPTRYRDFLAAGTSHVAGAMEPGGWWRSTWYQGPYYGTWAALRLLAQMRWPVPEDSVVFLLRAQRDAGFWTNGVGGDGDGSEVLPTALALLGLLAARRAGASRRGELDGAVDRGLAWLTGRCTATADWADEPFIRMDLHRVGGRPAHIVTWGSPTLTAAYVLKATAAAACRPPTAQA